MRKPFAVLSLALIAVVGLSACGVKDTVDKVSKSAENAQKQSEAFEARRKKADASTYKVTYKNEGTDAGTTGGEFTYAHKGKQSSLRSSNVLTIFDGNSKQVIICNELDTKPICTKTDAQGDADFLSLYGAGFFGGAITEFLSIVPGVDSKQSTRTIAGRDAECTEATPGEFLGQKLGDPGDKYISCYDKATGVALLYETQKQGKVESKVEATKFTEPTSSDFTPPVTPKSFDEQFQDGINNATSTTEPSTSGGSSSGGSSSGGSSSGDTGSGDTGSGEGGTN